MQRPATNSFSTPSSNREGYLKYKNRAVVIGWIGQLLSTVVLVSSALALQFVNDLVQLVVQVMNMPQEMSNRVKHALLMGSSAAYAMSLINMLVCALLLIGIARRCSALVFPWLFYHGLLFGMALYLAIYTIVSGVLVPTGVFLLAAAAFSVGLVLFFKIVNEVLMVFKWMHCPEEHSSAYRLEVVTTDRSNQNDGDFCVTCTY